MRHGEITKHLLSELYDDLEEVLLAALAAGVPRSQIAIQHPRVVYGEHDFSVRLEAKIFWRKT